MGISFYKNTKDMLINPAREARRGKNWGILYLNTKELLINPAREARRENFGGWKRGESLKEKRFWWKTHHFI